MLMTQTISRLHALARNVAIASVLTAAGSGQVSAQLPAPPTPSDGAADGNILQLTNNSAKDLTDVAAVVFLTLISFGFIAAVVMKFVQWRQNRAELGEVAMVGGVGAVIVGVAAVVLNNATGYITAL